MEALPRREVRPVLPVFPSGGGRISAWKEGAGRLLPARVRAARRAGAVLDPVEDEISIANEDRRADGPPELPEECGGAVVHRDRVHRREQLLGPLCRRGSHHLVKDAADAAEEAEDARIDTAAGRAIC